MAQVSAKEIMFYKGHGFNNQSDPAFNQVGDFLHQVHYSESSSQKMLYEPVLSGSGQKRKTLFQSQTMPNSIIGSFQKKTSIPIGSSDSNFVQTSDTKRKSAQKVIELKIQESLREIDKLKAMRDQLLQSDPEQRNSFVLLLKNRSPLAGSKLNSHHNYSQFDQAQMREQNSTSNKKHNRTGVFKSILDEMAISSAIETSKKQENSDFKDLTECKDLFYPITTEEPFQKDEDLEESATFTAQLCEAPTPQPNQNFVDQETLPTLPPSIIMVNIEDSQEQEEIQTAMPQPLKYYSDQETQPTLPQAIMVNVDETETGTQKTQTFSSDEEEEQAIDGQTLLVNNFVQ